MDDRWYVGLPGGREVWIHADEARIDQGYLVLSRSGAMGSSVALAAAPGEWTTLTPQPTGPAADFIPELAAFCSGLDTAEPRGPVAVLMPRPDAERRRTIDRRRVQVAPGIGVNWTGIERRSGLERRAS